MILLISNSQINSKGGGGETVTTLEGCNLRDTHLFSGQTHKEVRDLLHGLRKACERVIETEGHCAEVGPFPVHAPCAHLCVCCRMLAGDDMGKHRLYTYFSNGCTWVNEYQMTDSLLC